MNEQQLAAWLPSLIVGTRNSIIACLRRGQWQDVKHHIELLERELNPSGNDSGEEAQLVATAIQEITAPFEKLFVLFNESAGPAQASDTATAEAASNEVRPDSPAVDQAPLVADPVAAVTQLLSSLKDTDPMTMLSQALLKNTRASPEALKKYADAIEQITIANKDINDYRSLLYSGGEQTPDMIAARDGLLNNAYERITRAKADNCDGGNPGLSSYAFGKCLLWQKSPAEAIPLFDNAITENPAHLPGIIKELNLFAMMMEEMSSDHHVPDKELIEQFLQEKLSPPKPSQPEIETT